VGTGNIAGRSENGGRRQLFVLFYHISVAFEKGLFGIFAVRSSMLLYLGEHIHSLREGTPVRCTKIFVQPARIFSALCRISGGFCQNRLRHCLFKMYISPWGRGPPQPVTREPVRHFEHKVENNLDVYVECDKNTELYCIFIRFRV
jgi:hypothetical protein